MPMGSEQEDFYIFASYDGKILGFVDSDDKDRNFSPVWRVQGEECAEAIADALAQHFEEDVSVSVGAAKDWPLSARLRFDADLAQFHENRKPPHLSPEGMKLAGWLPFEMAKYAIELHEAYLRERKRMTKDKDDPPVDFFDPAVETESPQREILQYLRELSPTWRGFRRPERHAEEMAVGVLVIARGVEIEDGQPPRIRLTLSGERWREMLVKDANGDKTAGLVLNFVWLAYKRHVPEEKAGTSDMAANAASEAGAQSSGKPAEHGAPAASLAPMMGAMGTGERTSFKVKDKWGERMLIIPETEPPWAGDPTRCVLQIEALTGTRLKDGENPCRFMRLYKRDYGENRDPAAPVSFADFVARLHSDWIDVVPTVQQDEQRPAKPAARKRTGVSLMDAALLLNEENRDAAVATKRRWQSDPRYAALAKKSIGVSASHRQTKLYEPSEILAFIGKIENPSAANDIAHELRRIAKPVRG